MTIASSNIFAFQYSCILAFSHSRIRSRGSAEDELGDGGERYTKLRPMWVEMYGMNWNRWLEKNQRWSNP